MWWQFATTSLPECSLLEVPGGSWDFLGLSSTYIARTGRFWRFLGTPGGATGGSWRLLELQKASGGFWRLLEGLLEAPGGSWRLLEAPGDSWRLLAPRASRSSNLDSQGVQIQFWRLLEASGGFWRLLGAPGGAIGGSCRLLETPGDSWALLSGGFWRLL